MLRITRRRDQNALGGGGGHIRDLELQTKINPCSPQSTVLGKRCISIFQVKIIWFLVFTKKEKNSGGDFTGVALPFM